MKHSHAFKAKIWFSYFVIVIALIGIYRIYPVMQARASLMPSGTGQIADNPDCTLLDNSQTRGIMSGMFELKLLILCGRINELEQVKSTPIKPEALGLDVLVNNPNSDVSGTAWTQSETTLALNETNGILCSAYNDSYHYFTDGIGFTGFSSSNDHGATWTDHGAIPRGSDNGFSFGDPSLIWRKSDGHFYIATLYGSGMSLWDLGTNCTSASWIIKFHSGNDDKEIMAVDNNPSSPYYGRLYVAWTDLTGGHIWSTYSNNKTTWSTALDDSLKNNVHAAWPAVDPVNHDIYIAWIHWDAWPGGTFDIEMVHSTNGGSSFSYLTNPVNNVTLPRDAAASTFCDRPALNGDIRYQPAPELAIDNNSVLHIVYSYDPDGYNIGDVVNVYYRRSTNHGASWSPEIKLNDDATNRDQFFPALSISPSGFVGAFWYDRRLNSDNVNYDYYEAISTDNGLTFKPNIRISDASSPIVLSSYTSLCYHGDYDTSGSDSSHFYIQWSDDRGGTPDVYMDTISTVPDFTLDATPDSLGVCKPDDGQFSVALNSLWGDSQAVTLNASGNPSGTTTAFNINPISPPGTSLLTIGNTNVASPGSYDIAIQGNDQTHLHNTTVGMNLFSGTPGIPGLLNPVDGAIIQPLNPTFDWSNLSQYGGYDFELATSPLFDQPLVYTTELTTSTFTIATPLNEATCYWWNTKAVNACGSGQWADPYHFSTVDLGYSFYDDMESGPGKWSHAAGQGSDQWVLSTITSHSTSHSWFQPDPDSIADVRLWTTVPIQIGSLDTLSFWHRYAFEDPNFDGSVLEISTNGGGTWSDLGPHITANGYNGTISSDYGNPLSGRQAWVSDQDAWTQVIVDLSSFAGQSALIRWRFGSDSSTYDTGWFIDDVQITTPLPPTTAPTLSSITPNTGDNRSRTDVVINGMGFFGSPAIKLGDTWLAEENVIDRTTIHAVVLPGLPKGVYDLTIYNGDCQSAVLPDAFTVTGITKVFLPVTLK